MDVEKLLRADSLKVAVKARNDDGKYIISFALPCGGPTEKAKTKATANADDVTNYVINQFDNFSVKPVNWKITDQKYPYPSSEYTLHQYVIEDVSSQRDIDNLEALLKDTFGIEHMLSKNAVLTSHDINFEEGLSEDETRGKPYYFVKSNSKDKNQRALLLEKGDDDTLQKTFTMPDACTSELNIEIDSGAFQHITFTQADDITPPSATPVVAGAISNSSMIT